MEQPNDDGQEEMSALFDCLAQQDRRRLLDVLSQRKLMTHQELAAVLAAQEPSDDQQPTESVRRAMVELLHKHLPVLAAVGLVDESGEGPVTITDHTAFEDAGVVAILADETDADDESLDALFECLANGRRRTILNVLSHQLTPIHVETLAREVGAIEQETTERSVPADALQRVLVSCHHNHVPKLADAGLIEYDTDEEIVAYEGHPELRVPWMDSVLDTDFAHV